jgi:poly-gamma-glutamate synthesis protein (capsule biosynthesis protein)
LKPFRRLLLSAVVCGCLPLSAEGQARDTLRIAFVGDLNFGRSLARNYIFEGRSAEILAGVRDRLRAADIAVGNLESILLERGRHADTTNSPVFAGPQAEGIAILRDAGFDVLGNANNHAWDFGRAGLLENLAHLDSAGLAHAGTGATLGAAWRPVVVRTKGWTIAFFSLTAIFNYPDLTVAGHPAECCVAWADTLRAAERFRTVRDSVGADLVIAYVHAGMEYRPVPEPDVVIRFRALIRAGADAVIGHHPHVPQGIEYLDGKPIVYSLGNFVFKQGQAWTDRALWADMVVAPGHGGTGAPISLQLVALGVGYTPHFLTGADSAAVMAHVDSISGRIPARPRLPNPRPRRNVAHPRMTPRNR